MAISNNYQLRKGDKVAAVGTLEYDVYTGEPFYLNTGGYGNAIIQREVCKLVSTVLQSGDEVAPHEDFVEGVHFPGDVMRFGIVKAMADGRAWIAWPLGDAIEQADSLIRVRTAEQVEANAERPHEHLSKEEVEARQERDGRAAALADAQAREVEAAGPLAPLLRAEPADGDDDEAEGNAHLGMDE